MSGHIENLGPLYRRSMRVAGVGAVVAGTTNTQIINFTGVTLAAVVQQGTALPIGTTAVAPLPASQTWVNVVADVVYGTTFKFTKRGIFMCRLSAVEIAANTAASQLGITIDCPAANLAVAAPLTDTTVGMMDYSNYLGLANSQVPGKVVGAAYISDALAGGAQASGATPGVGVVRFHASNGVSAIVAATTYTAATYRADITYLGDIAG